MTHGLRFFLGFLFIFCAPLALAQPAGNASQAPNIGIIQMISGTASIVREDYTVRATRNAPLYIGDTLQTGPNSQLQFRLADGAIVFLTSNSALQIASFEYDPANPANGRLVLNLIRGGVHVETGEIGRTDAERFVVITPFGSVNASDAVFTMLVDLTPGGNGLLLRNEDGVVIVSNNQTSVAIGDGVTVQIGVNGGPIELLDRIPDDLQRVRIEAGVEVEAEADDDGVGIVTDGDVRIGDPTPEPSGPQPSTPGPSPSGGPSPTPTVQPSSPPSGTPPPPSVAPSGVPSPPPSGVTTTPTIAPSIGPTPPPSATPTPSVAPSSQPTPAPSTSVPPIPLPSVDPPASPA